MSMGITAWFTSDGVTDKMRSADRSDYTDIVSEIQIIRRQF